MVQERFFLFWGGPFSQWCSSAFKVNGIQYNCAEQYMMAEKARLFGDKRLLALIMASNDPSEQKSLGRQVADFDTKRWNKVARDIVYTGNYAKFTQNPDLKEFLLATQGTTIVEASPYDTIWGIGLDEDDPRAQDRSQWRGTNWLGEVIMRVRDTLMQEGQ